MKNFILAALVLAISGTVAYGQESEPEIVAIVDDLRYKWDDEAEGLKTYEGLLEYCRTKPYRDKITKLLDDIHHYDSTLYDIVRTKYDENEDPEAAATIEDIEKLELDYKTRSFRSFLLLECTKRNDLDRNAGRTGLDRNSPEVLALEKELANYVEQVTMQVDVVDEHIHHLHGLGAKSND